MNYLKYLLSKLKSIRVQIIILIVVIFIAYSNIFANTFVWDDKDTVLNWQLTRSWNSAPLMFQGAFPPGHPGNYRPVRNIIYILDYHLWGLNPIGYHFQSIFLQISITLVLFFIVRRLTRDRLIPFLTALFFGVHPIHVEAIAWITSSMDMWGVLFGVVSIFFYIKFTTESRKKIIYFISSFILGALAIFANEIALALPLIILGYELYFSKRNLLNKFLRSVPYWIIVGVNFYIRSALLHIGARFEYIGGSAYLTGFLMMRAFVEYMKIFFFPFPFFMNINHLLGPNLTSWSVELIEKGSPIYRAVLSQSLFDPKVLLGISLVLLLLVMLIKTRKKMPLVSFSLFWFFAFFGPVSNLIPTEAMMTERYLYLPSFGLCIIVAVLLTRYIKLTDIRNGSNLIGWGIIGGITTILSIFTLIQNTMWLNDKVLSSTDVARNPYSFIGQATIGDILYSEGNNKEALSHYLIVQKLAPERSENYFRLAAAYSGVDNRKEATYLNIAIAKSQPTADLYFRLGNIYKGLQEYDKAIESYKAGLKLDSDYPPILNNLGVIYSIKKNWPMAEFFYKKALEINPEYKNAQVNLQRLYEETAKK